MKTEKELQDFYGKVEKFKSPSGYYFTIREQTGDDEDIISRMKDAKDGSSVNKFVSAIVVDNDYTDNSRLTESQVESLKLNDKYYILLKSRILSLGSDLTYTHKCGNTLCEKENDYEEDLNNFDCDLELVDTNMIDDKYPGIRVKPYKYGKDEFRELVLDSGKKLRYRYLDGKGEKRIINLNKDNITINQPLLSRDLSLFKDDSSSGSGQWVKIQRFDVFTSKEMQVIRRDVMENDKQFTIDSEVTCPHCNHKEVISLILLPAFFFPTGE